MSRSRAVVCPLCRGPAKPVRRRTPESLLRNASGLGKGPFFFCPTPDCAAVYFDASGSGIYFKRDLKVRVGLKETSDPIPICYCFDFTRAMVRAELERTGTTTIPDRIKAGIAAKRCACDLKNPQGSCCLANVNATVKSLLETERNPA